MIKIPFNDIVAKIKEKSGISEEEINSKVDEKLKQLSGLVSKEGAAHIVANELGVKIFEDIGRRKFKIKDILPGMRSVSITGKIVRLYDVREYNKNNRHGKVVSFVMGDETGIIRVVFWDTHHIAEIENGNLKEGNILRIKNAYVRENQGFKEVHLSNQSRIFINPEGEKIEDVKFRDLPEYFKKQVKDLNENEIGVGVFGTIVQVFEPRFYEVCSECGRRVKLEEGKFLCDVHGVVKEKFVPVMNAFFDDGTGSIRVVCFRDLVKELLDLEEEKIDEFRENPEKFEMLKKNILGKQLVVIGRVSKNEMFDRPEFTAQKILRFDPREVAEELINEVVK